tara:strand:+ start:135 stop:452 length:318 start_codon:yes stop_codon:yes gene_type:complete
MDYYLIYYFTLSIIVGFIISYYVHYIPVVNDINNENKKKLILFWNKKIYHIHHWITFSIVIFLILLGSCVSNAMLYIFIGLSLGTILEDFLFDDIFKIEKEILDI